MISQRVEIVGIDNLEKIVEETGYSMETAAIELSQDLAQAFVQTTPYVTGNLRASWFTDLNNPNPEGFVVAGFGTQAFQPETVPVTVGRMSAAIAHFQNGDTIYFKNSAFYAGYVEYGTIKMAPRAWVRGVIDQLDYFVANVIRRLGVKGQ